jgi:hypothetical protein
MAGAMLKAFQDQVEKEVDKTPHALRKEELDLIHLLEQRTKRAAA